VTSNRQFDKEGRQNFLLEGKENGKNNFLERVDNFYKNNKKYLLKESWWLLL